MSPFIAGGVHNVYNFKDDLEKYRSKVQPSMSMRSSNDLVNLGKHI